MFKQLSLAAALVALCATSQAQVITQWNFNASSLAPSVGSGTAALVGGTTSPGFSSGVGSSDPAASGNVGWQTTTYPAVSAADKTAGVSFLVSTLGFSNITLNYDLRHSNTSSRYEQVQYTTNSGTSWVDVALFDGNAGDTWFNNRSVSLAAIPAVNNIAGFGFRVVSTFGPGNTAYQPSNPASNYATTGTWRFDMATVTAVPEPGTYAMMFAGLAMIGVMAARRRG